MKKKQNKQNNYKNMNIERKKIEYDNRKILGYAK